MSKHALAVALGACLLAASVACSPTRVATTLFVDAQGFFVMGPWGSGTVETPWYRGNGVRCVLVSSGAPGTVCGRLEDGAEKAVLYRAAPDGSLTSIQFEVRPAGDELQPFERVREALRALSSTPADVPDPHWPLLGLLMDTSAPLHRADFDPEPLPVGKSAGPPKPGAELAAWAPADLVFARSRSLTAAFRMVGELDGVVDLLALRQGPTPSGETLRLTLHHLLLPTIWNTNPGAETGVGEVAVVLAPPFAPGVLRAAVLLRIEDPELHYMQTTAGISQEGQEDHLWRPADDPFPGERVRHPFRTTIGDVEVVATDQDLHDRLVAGVARPLSADAGYRAARADAGPVVRDEALFVYVPPQVDLAPARLRAARRNALRTEAGWRYLANAWCGAVDLAPRGTLQPELFQPSAQAPPSLLERVHWMRLVTDPDGALGTLRLRNPADDVARDLSKREIPGPSCDAACAHQRHLLTALGGLDRRGAAGTERAFVVLGHKPACPVAGSYSTHPVLGSVSCSIHGSEAALKAGPGAALPLRDVTVNGDRVSFRLEIDWRRRQ